MMKMLDYPHIFELPWAIYSLMFVECPVDDTLDRIRAIRDIVREEILCRI